MRLRCAAVVETSLQVVPCAPGRKRRVLKRRRLLIEWVRDYVDAKHGGAPAGAREVEAAAVPLFFLFCFYCASLSGGSF